MARFPLFVTPGCSQHGLLLSSVIAVALCFATTGVAKAQTVIDFEGLGLGNGQAIANNYKTFAPGTPNVAVSFRTYNLLTDATVSNNLLYWFDNYGDLVNVAYADGQGFGAEVILTPDAGFQITLESFDLGGWLDTDRQATTLRLADGLNNAYSGFDYAAAAGGSFTVLGAGGTIHSAFTPNLTSTGPIRIQWGPDFNTGIDNVRFSQAAAVVTVPEPGSVALLATGAFLLGGIGIIRRNRKNAA